MKSTSTAIYLGKYDFILDQTKRALSINGMVDLEFLCRRIAYRKEDSFCSLHIIHILCLRGLNTILIIFKLRYSAGCSGLIILAIKEEFKLSRVSTKGVIE